ncbi:hypothetical protein [Streptomyces sp. NPDC048142]|uniref:hypothetical protein n=1 Tax=Streptomyces sp. NPDC048142 TaxID=3365501 RepID=UPI00372319BB
MNSWCDASLAVTADAELLGASGRAGGTGQLTVGGRSVCRYVKDTAPGRVNGQGAGGTWFAAAPDGSYGTSPRCGNARMHPVGGRPSAMRRTASDAAR